MFILRDHEILNNAFNEMFESHLRRMLILNDIKSVKNVRVLEVKKKIFLFFSKNFKTVFIEVNNSEYIAENLIGKYNDISIEGIIEDLAKPLKLEKDYKLEIIYI